MYLLKLGECFVIKNLMKFCEDNNLSYKYLQAISSKKPHYKHKGYRVEKVV